ncbi:MAG: T9SS type A sorting domain-containing protein [Flavobacteriales bacterium]|jgi:hypothetical protein|nr:T9SS type A sorting domain-containing protein [Flavobacteriales bacterium]
MPKAGTNFHAVIHPCNSGGNSFKSTAAGYSDLDWNSPLKASETLWVQPNPSSGTFSVILQQGYAPIVHLELFNAQGVKVPMILSSTDSPITISLGTANSAGVYTLRVYSEDGTHWSRQNHYSTMNIRQAWLLALVVFIEVQLPVNGQYLAFPDSNAAWVTLETLGPDPWGEITYYMDPIKQEIVINDTAFIVVHSNPANPGALYDNGFGKIYYHDSLAATTYLIYDYSAQQGDTVNVWATNGGGGFLFLAANCGHN